MMATSNNPYLTVVERNLPRILSLISADKAGSAYGIVDRRYWAWKTVDFPNASMQAIASGMARLAKQEHLSKEFSDVRFGELTVEIIKAIKPMLSRSGGLSEAFPNENSFCVTGQVLADALDALIVLKSNITETTFDNLLEILEPLAIYLQKHTEKHAIISNHLATSALGLVRWAKLTGNNEYLMRAEYFINIIRRHANSQGWFLEYSGADPGYQSWALSSLTQIHLEKNGLIDKSFLSTGYKFIAQFAMNDGSFGNGAGSRLTNFLISSGPELFASENQCARYLASFSRKHIISRKFVSLDSIDEPNLAQFFNDVVRCSEQFDEMPIITCDYQRPQLSIFSEAGLLVRHDNLKSVIVSAQRGGWTCVTTPNKPRAIFHQTVMKNSTGTLFIADSTRDLKLNDYFVIVRAPIRRLNEQKQSTFRFLFIRFYILSIGRLSVIRELLKKVLVKFLITRKFKEVGTFVRVVNLNTMEVSDSILNCELEIVPNEQVPPYHMASYGYWNS